MSHELQPSPYQPVFEELESRAMLAANGIGVLAGGGFPVDNPSIAQVPALFGPGSAGSALASPFASGAGAIGVNTTSGTTGIVFGPAVSGGNTGLGFNLIGSDGTSVALTGTSSGTSSIVAVINGNANVALPRELNSIGPDAKSGVGQMTITTGAGTLGISSFATATNGFSDTIGAGGMVPPAPPSQQSDGGGGAEAGAMPGGAP